MVTQPSRHARRLLVDVKDNVELFNLFLELKLTKQENNGHGRIHATTLREGAAAIA